MQPRAWFAGDVNTIMLKQGSEPAASPSAQHKPVLVWVMSVLMDTFQPRSTVRRIHVIMYCMRTVNPRATRDWSAQSVCVMLCKTLLYVLGDNTQWFKFKTTTALGFRLAAEQKVSSQLISLSFWNFARVMWGMARLKTCCFKWFHDTCGSVFCM